MPDKTDRLTNVEEQRRLYRAIGQTFSPAAPIALRDLFAGRTTQMHDLIDIVDQAGQHAIIFGERGVGKTSLVTVMAEILRDERFTARVNCYGTDTFSSVWRKALSEITLTRQVPKIGFNKQSKEVVMTASEMIANEPVQPDDVRKALQILGSVRETVIVIDEFDRLNRDGAQTLFADTIKALSDHLVQATVVLVGVADNVDELIAEHQSVERALVQVPMPRMSEAELAEIINRGLGAVGMKISRDARDWITRLSQGLPHYTHLLSQLAARSAVRRNRRNIGRSDVDRAIEHAIDKVQESISSMYHQATSSTRQNMYPQVLLACALAESDDRGFFASTDVREPLSRIMGTYYDIPQFAQHLKDFSEEKRGQVLQKVGRVRSFRYRFRNPLLQPYVVMRGLSSRMITPVMIS